MRLWQKGFKKYTPSVLGGENLFDSMFLDGGGLTDTVAKNGDCIALIFGGKVNFFVSFFSVSRFVLF